MKIILVLITLTAILFVVADLSHPPNPAHDLKARQIAATAMSRVDPGKFGRQVIISRADGNHLEFQIAYSGEASRINAAVDAMDLVKQIVLELVRQGRSPSKEGITVQVEARRVGLRGLTGEALYVPFGRAFYDAIHDRVDYDPPK